ncbi:hypothetical protein CC2G_014147 [Coprinopsis cinerea AmutBmut pab1-1]|nr:hypothetical protein CC2G_014147 [Coprinopsis cinerea AmutBmut pab1-1]
MITITFIRHGESEDNKKRIWAGWKDAPLSKLGQRQAQAVGEFFANTRFTHIYASDLRRAHDTGKAVHSRLQQDPKPPFTVTPLVREQNFGVAEGNAWIVSIPEGSTREEQYSQGVYPVLWERHEKFDGGESLDDLARRAEEALRECVWPHLVRAVEGGNTSGSGGDSGVHIAIASHGLAISEMVSAVTRLDPELDASKSYKGLLNTAWARAEVRVRDGHSGPIDLQKLPPLEVKVTHFNETQHLDGLPEELSDGEEVSATSDEARAFFGGGGATATVPKANARVEVEKAANL